MSEHKAAAVNSDEILLAQLACLKLAGLTQGAISIGLPALATGVPDPRTRLLDEQFPVLTAFARVLHTASGPGWSTQEFVRLRETSGRLLNTLEDLRGELLAILDDPTSPTRLGNTQKTAATFFDTLSQYAGLIRLEGSAIVKAKSISMQVFEAVEKMSNMQEIGAK